MFLQLLTLICVLITLQVVYYQIKIKLNLTLLNNINEKIFSGVMSGLMAVLLSLYSVETNFDIYIGLGVISLIICLIYSGSSSFLIGYLMFGIWSYALNFIEPAFPLFTYILAGIVLIITNSLVKNCKLYVKGTLFIIIYTIISSLTVYIISNDINFVLKFTFLYLIFATMSVFINMTVISYMQNYVKMFNQMEIQATHDALTGLRNRAQFNDVMNRLDPKKKVSLLIIDVDKFKFVNDTYGHKVGDMVLINVAHTMESIISVKRSLARIGGEEFAVILHDHSLEEAINIAEELRKSVEAIVIKNEELNQTINVTVSIGIASHPKQTKSIDDLYELADERLYISKKLGRNQVQYDSSLNILSKNTL